MVCCSAVRFSDAPPPLDCFFISCEETVSGNGSRALSILPLGFSGILERGTKSLGMAYAGSFSRRCARSASTVKTVPVCGTK